MIVAIIVRLIEGEQEVEHHIFKYSNADELREGFTELKQRFPHGIFGTANFTEHTPRPEGHETPRGLYWCPWCAEDLPFYMDPVFNLERCIMCRISTKDYFIRKYNDIRVMAESKETEDDDS